MLYIDQQVTYKYTESCLVFCRNIYLNLTSLTTPVHQEPIQRNQSNTTDRIRTIKADQDPDKQYQQTT